MLRRFFIYLIGVSLGVMISLFFFGNREIDFSYFPNARTLKHLRNQNFVISSSAKCHLDSLGINTDRFKELFQKTSLDVDFGASDIQRLCPTYLIEVENQNFSSFIISDCDSLTTLISLEDLDFFCP